MGGINRPVNHIIITAISISLCFASITPAIAEDSNIPTPSVSPTTQISPTPQSSPTPSGPKVVIINSPSSINADSQQVARLKVEFIGGSHHSYRNNTYFLRVVIYEPNTTRYFGLNRNNQGSWYSGSDNRNEWYQFETNENGYWTGEIDLMIDTDHRNFKGEGAYMIKAGRYTQSGSSAANWSEERPLHIKFTPTPTRTPPSDTRQANVSPTAESVTYTGKPAADNDYWVQGKIFTPTLRPITTPKYPAVATIAGIIDFTSTQSATSAAVNDNSKIIQDNNRITLTQAIGAILLLISAIWFALPKVSQRISW